MASTPLTGAATVSVNLIPPATLWGERNNNIDLRIAKILRYGATRTQIGVDIFNLTNNDTVTNYNYGFVQGGAWLTPTTIVPARYARISAQVDEDTLAGLVDAVQGMVLYPAGLSCTLTQTPILVGLGGAASAAPEGGYVVGSGRFQVGCPASAGTYWVNFGITAQTATGAAGTVA